MFAERLLFAPALIASVTRRRITRRRRISRSGIKRCSLLSWRRHRLTTGALQLAVQVPDIAVAVRHIEGRQLLSASVLSGAYCAQGRALHSDLDQGGSMNEHELREVVAMARAGRVSRRAFVRKLVALGLTAPLASQQTPGRRCELAMRAYDEASS